MPQTKQQSRQKPKPQLQLKSPLHGQLQSAPQEQPQKQLQKKLQTKLQKKNEFKKLGLKTAFPFRTFFGIAIGFLSIAWTHTVRAEVSLESAIQLQSNPTHSRLQLSFDDSFQFKIRDLSDGFEIFVPTASLMDLGIPFGLEGQLDQHLKSVNDSRLKQVRIFESEGGVKVRGIWRFPEGKAALANPSMEHFDFRNKDTGKFVLDFWYKKGPTRAEVERQKASELKSNEKKIAEEKQRKIDEQEAIRQAKIQESKDALAFCKRPFDKANTVFMRFRPDHPTIHFQSYFPENVPDHRFEYTIPSGETEEDQMIQLAIKLYRENKHGLAVKTIEFVFKEYPKTKLRNELEFLNANAHFRLGFEDKAIQLLRDIAKTARGTEVGLHAAGFLAIRSYRSKEWLAALDSFLRIQREFPSHPMIWLFRYGAADSLFHIRQTDRALEEYTWVSENAPKDQIRAEAAFKVGNVYFDRNQFAQAIQSYTESLKKFPKEATSNSFAILNLAESYFQLAEIDRSQAEFSRYLESTPAHTSAWRASLRLAEIKAMRAQNVESDGYMDAFRETINRYPLTPGTVVARMRLLPCGDHGGFDLGSMQRFFESKEVLEFSGNDSVIGPQFQELLGLTELRSYLAFKQDETALKRGIFHLQRNPSLAVRKLLEAGVLSAVKRLLTNDLDQGKMFAAMESFEKYGELLPAPGMDPVADQIRNQLTKFAAEKGMEKVVKKITDPFSALDSSKWGKVITHEEKNEQEDRLISEVKAVWNTGKYDPAETLKKLEMIRGESKLAKEKALFSALLYHKQGKTDEALNQLQLAFNLSKSDPAEQLFLAQTAARIAKAKSDQENGNIDTELKWIRESKDGLKFQSMAEQHRQKTGILQLPAFQTAEQLVIREGEILEKAGRQREALDCYTKAIENGIRGSRIYYAHAQSLLRQGDPTSRKRAIASLESVTEGYWKTLAQKVLEEVKTETTNAKEGK